MRAVSRKKTYMFLKDAFSECSHAYTSGELVERHSILVEKPVRNDNCYGHILIGRATNERHETRTNISIKVLTGMLYDAIQKKSSPPTLCRQPTRIFSNNNNVTDGGIKIKNNNK